MAKSSVIFTALIMAFVLLFVGLGLFYYHYKWSIMRFPLAIGLAVVLFGAVSLAVEVRAVIAQRRQGAVKPSEAEVLPGRANFRRDFTGMAWALASLPTIIVCGYIAGLPLYTFIYFKAHGRGWGETIAYSLATFAVVYLGFYKLLGVPLPVTPFDLR
jgi:Tripartite tricarboxylate transporter TctB family